MLHLIRIRALFVAICATPIVATATETVLYSEPLTALEWVADSNSGVVAKPVAGLSQRMSFQALGQQFDIELTENRALAKYWLDKTDTAPPSVYRGTITGMPGSWVRLTNVNGNPQGMIFDGREHFAIEPIAGKTQIFRLKDLKIAPNALGCGVEHAVSDGEALAKTIGEDRSPAEAPGARQEITIALIADTAFSDRNGNDTDAVLIALMNVVDGIFSEQVGVQLTVTRIDSFPGGGDPFSETTDASDLLGELSGYRRTTPAQNSNGLSHLFTARDLDGRTAGIAYRGALCSSRFSAGLTEATRTATTNALVAAHEIGHNFGAPHDDEEGSACEDSPGGFLMAPTINGSDQFSACSLREISADVQAASCVTALASRDVGASRGAQAPAVLLGQQGSVDFDVNNLGTESVSAVQMTIDIPTGVSLVSASATVGSCNNGAGQVICDIGNLASGAGATVDVAFNANSVGGQTFDASVSASTDDNGTNDAASETVLVTAAVDLRAVSDASASVTVDESIRASLGVQNLATIDATNVTVTIAPGNGIRIDGAAWSAGTCTIQSTGNAVCEATRITAGQTSLVDVDFLATEVGSSSYNVTVSGTETDIDNGNNAASGSITVNAASTGGNTGGGNTGGGSSGGDTGGVTGSDSGGGAVSPIWALAFAIAAMVRRRRRTV
ncbi:MAG: M12 family metallo-peptidase [Pseudomonadota bacterium]